MALYIQLWLAFFKIGAVSYGGGYVILSYILAILEQYGWMAESEFSNLVGLSYITPGAIAINAATYIGYRTTGIFGGFFTTFGVALPSVIYMAIVSKFSDKLEDNQYFISFMFALKPAATALMVSAVTTFMRSIFLIPIGESSILYKFAFLVDFSKYVNPISIFIAVISIVLIKFRAHNLAILGIAAVLGLLLF